MGQLESTANEAGRLGPCQLEWLLGQGSWATVYRALMVEDRPYAKTGETVAVKVLSTERVAVERDLRRFLREAEIGQMVSHPSVVRTYEVGEGELERRPCHYLVMEYVEGRTLARLLERLTIVPEALLRSLGLQIATALEALHSRSVVHRDLKPTNVLLTPDYQVKLSDMGVAHLAEATTRLTEAGVFIGTLSYAAPEQIEGLPLTPAVDLYALGVMLYEAVTGNQPFTAADVRTVIRNQLQLVPPKAGQLNPQLSPFFEELVASLMEKEPTQRFASAEELASVLKSGEASGWWKERERSLRGLRQVRVRRDSRFVGREPELGRLRDGWQEALKGKGCAILLEGEPGVGKSRLIDQFVAGIADDAHLLYGSESPGARWAGGALSQAVLGYLGKADLDTALQRWLTEAPRLAQSFAAWLRGLPPPAGIEPLDLAGVRAAFALLAQALAGSKPMVWVVEDLHLGSAESLALLQSLVAVGRDLRLLLVVSARSGISSGAAASLRELEHVHHLLVERLPERPVEELLSEVLGRESAIAQLRLEIARRCGGNPFFAIEMARELKDSALEAATLAEGSDPAEQSTRRSRRAAVPRSVREILERRLAALSTEDRALLDVAAVQGHTFDVELVALARKRDDMEVLERLAELERGPGLVRSRGATFELDHHLLQEHLYAVMPELLRQRYHGRLAEVVESRTRDALGEDVDGWPASSVVFCAEHHLKSHRPDEASRFVLPAIDHLARSYQNERLLELAELALGSLDQAGAALRCDILLRRSNCLYLLGRRDEEAAAAQEAFAVASQAGDERRAALARLAEGRARIDAGEEAVEILADALARSQKIGDRAAEASAIGFLGDVHVRGGNFEKARRHFEHQAQLCHELGDKLGEATAGAYLGEALLGRGLAEEATGHLERSLELCQELRHGHGEARARTDLGLACFFRGLMVDSKRHFERGIALCREIGFVEGQIVALSNFVEVAMQEGALEEARALLAAARELGVRLRSPFYDGYLAAYEAELVATGGEPERAERLWVGVIESFRRLGAHFGVVTSALALGRLYLEGDRRELAAPLFAEADELVKAHAMGTVADLPSLYRALLENKAAEGLEVPATGQLNLRAEGHLVLFRAGAGTEHLRAAIAMLDTLSAHLHGADLDMFWQRQPIASAVAKAARGAGIEVGHDASNPPPTPS